MGYNVQLNYKNKHIHVGKQSMGWKFMFNFQALLQFALDCGEFVWFEGRIKNTLDNLKQLYRLETLYYWNRPNTNSNNTETIFNIYTIHPDIIEKILSLQGITLTTDDDYGELNVKDFIYKINNQSDKSKGMIGL